MDLYHFDYGFVPVNSGFVPVNSGFVLFFKVLMFIFRTYITIHSYLLHPKHYANDPQNLKIPYQPIGSYGLRVGLNGYGGVIIILLS